MRNCSRKFPPCRLARRRLVGLLGGGPASKISAKPPGWRRWAIPPASRSWRQSRRAAPITHANNSLWQPGAHELLPRSARQACRRRDHRQCLGDRHRQDAEHHVAQPHQFRKCQHGQSASAWKKCCPASAWIRRSLVKMGSDISNAGAGSIARAESISMTLAALVAQVLPNGNLVIDGHQQVRVNNELRDMRLSGIVRREDITQDNTVNLSQIAEARVILWRPRHDERCAAAALWLAAARHRAALVSGRIARSEVEIGLRTSRRFRPARWRLVRELAPAILAAC